MADPKGAPTRNSRLAGAAPLAPRRAAAASRRPPPLAAVAGAGQFLAPVDLRHRRTPCRGSTARLACTAAPTAASAASAPPPRFAAGLLRLLQRNYIPAALLAAVAAAWACPGPGATAAAAGLQPLATIGIFLISGLLLERGEAAAAARAPLALIYGLTAILLVTPLAGVAALRLPLEPRAAAVGLAVFCCAPTTLSSCVALTSAAGGNAATALLLVVASNALGVFTMPYAIGTVLAAGGAGGAGAAAAFDAPALLGALQRTVLAPLAAGAAAQALVPGLAAWRARSRPLLAYASTALLCLVPWMQVSAARRAGVSLPPRALAALAAAAAGAHLLMLGFNLAATRALRFADDPERDAAVRVAVVLAASQKTLPVAVAALAALPAAGAGGAAAGLAVVPCVMAHLLQLAIDSALVARWAVARERRAAAAAA
jgi:sodium/bile acid cotransporter 7